MTDNLNKKLEIGKEYYHSIKAEASKMYFIGKVNEGRETSFRFARPTDKGYDILETDCMEMNSDGETFRSTGKMKIYWIYDIPKSPCYAPKLYSQIKKVIGEVKRK
ncbi:MAG TPA: hypothetical protein ENG87_03435 [Candidatus Pacearchaeota archaeon]|nr:hypothetical protein [Candidatus Pacearchaeota archaeon]